MSQSQASSSLVSRPISGATAQEKDKEIKVKTLEHAREQIDNLQPENRLEYVSRQCEIYIGQIDRDSWFYDSLGDEIQRAIDALDEREREILRERQPEFFAAHKKIKDERSSATIAYSRLRVYLNPRLAVIEEGQSSTPTPLKRKTASLESKRAEAFYTFLSTHQATGKTFYEDLLTLFKIPLLTPRNAIHLLNEQIINRNKKHSEALHGNKDSLRAGLLTSDLAPVKRRARALMKESKDGYFRVEGYKPWELRELGLMFDDCGILKLGDYDAGPKCFPGRFSFDDEPHWGKKTQAWFPVPTFPTEDQVEPPSERWAATEDADESGTEGEDEAEQSTPATPTITRQLRSVVDPNSTSPPVVRKSLVGLAGPSTPSKKRKRVPRRSRKTASGDDSDQSEITFPGLRKAPELPPPNPGTASFFNLDNFAHESMYNDAPGGDDHDDDDDAGLPEERDWEQADGTITKRTVPDCSCSHAPGNTLWHLLDFSLGDFDFKKNALQYVAQQAEKMIQPCRRHLLGIMTDLDMDTEKGDLSHCLAKVFEVIKDRKSFHAA
jgi:hypothetical protein